MISATPTIVLPSGESIEGPTRALWRGVDAFRVVSWCYAGAAFFFFERPDYTRPAIAAGLLAVMLLWTILVPLMDRRPLWLLLTDLTLAVLMLLLNGYVRPWEDLANGDSTLARTWAAVPVLGLAVRFGVKASWLGSLAIIVANLLLIRTPGSGTWNMLALVVIAGWSLGHVTTVYRRSSQALQDAVALHAARAERERLAAEIHDSALQVLAMIQREGMAIGGPTEKLAQLAGDEERKLRRLVATQPPRQTVATTTVFDTADLSSRTLSPKVGGGSTDLVNVLSGVVTGDTEIVPPGQPVEVGHDQAEAINAAVLAALDNVARHAGDGAKSWVVIEDMGTEIIVTVRDDGVGMDMSRVAEAAGQGRMGLSLSITKRMQDIGARVDVWSAPGMGVEIELTVPREQPTRASG